MAKILLVEDNQAEALALRRMLEQGGFEVCLAHDGVEGLDKIKKDQPDLVLLDLMLPKMNGFDVLSHCKKDKATKNIPVIILTNLTQGDEDQKSISLGAADHLIKSKVNFSEIIQKIKKNLKKNE